MDDFKLKIILSILAGVVFSFLFIILAFALPASHKPQVIKIPKGVLEKVSESARNKP